MQLLYSNMLPLNIEDGQTTFIDSFNAQISQADNVDIAVGYVSKSSLMELERLVEENNVAHISLTIGMYYIEGMPESTYRTAMRLNQKWKDAGIGEIRIVRALQYHGKLYAFSRGGTVISAMIGSANLGAIKLEASNMRQFEISAITTEANECEQIMDFIRRLKQPRCSINIEAVTDMNIIRERNVSLTGVDTVEQIPQTEVALYQERLTDVEFPLPIKVPSFSERFMDDNRHYTKSNLNVCYAAPRSARKPRDWYETQFTVSTKIRTDGHGNPAPGYPTKNVPFVVVTDDGYTFKCHTTSDGNKQFSAVGDELILGRWLKGRLAAAGLVDPVNDTKLDTERLGMITKEMLNDYGCNSLMLRKTDCQKNVDGTMMDVWLLSFEAGQQDGEA